MMMTTRLSFPYLIYVFLSLHPTYCMPVFSFVSTFLSIVTYDL